MSLTPVSHPARVKDMQTECRRRCTPTPHYHLNSHGHCNHRNMSEKGSPVPPWKGAYEVLQQSALDFSCSRHCSFNNTTGLPGEVIQSKMHKHAVWPLAKALRLLLGVGAVAASFLLKLFLHRHGSLSFRSSTLKAIVSDCI